MMKSLALILGTLIAFSAQAGELRILKKIDANNAEVRIAPDGKVDEGIQVATFVDGKEIQNFIEFMTADAKSELAKLKVAIEIENCDQPSRGQSSHIEGCGEVEISQPVLTSYGRGGWAEAGGTYTLFVGFRSDGTGHFLESTHMINISEEVSADVDDQGEYKGTVTKKLSMMKISKIP